MDHDNFKQLELISKNLELMGTIIANAMPPISSSLVLYQDAMEHLISVLNQLDTSRFDALAATMDHLSEVLSKSFSQPVHRSLMQYEDALSRLADSFARYNFNYSETLADNLSNRFVELSNEVLDDFSSYDLPPEISEEISKTSEGSQAGFISLERMITIIALIITIFSFIHDLLPDKSIQETNRKLQQLIEIQERQLELMEQAAESESPEGSELPLHQPQEEPDR